MNMYEIDASGTIFDHISLNDDNLKPNWVNLPARYTEIHARREKESLLIVIGESWTYGENLTGIQSATGNYNLHTQLYECFGPKLAYALDVDFYQYAVPGNCNLYMFEELDRILKYTTSLGIYKNIYICLQMTEQSRELPVLHMFPDHPITKLYNDSSTISFEDYLQQYEEIYCKIYDDTITRYKDIVNIDAILWRNFCRRSSTKDDYQFKHIDRTWIEHSFKLMGIKFQSPLFYSANWVSDLYELETKIFLFDFIIINAELDKLEKSNNFIITSKK